MSFGAAKSISRRMPFVRNYQALVLDLREVPTIGVTAALAIESIVQDSLSRQRHVWVVVALGQVQRRIETLELHRLSGSMAKTATGQAEVTGSRLHQVGDRFQALTSALALLHPKGHPDIHPDILV